MKKRIFTLSLAALLLVVCAAVPPTKLRIENNTETDSIEIAKAVLLENDYILIKVTDDVIMTDYKVVDEFTYKFRYRAIVNTVDEQNFRLTLDKEMQIENSQWHKSPTIGKALTPQVMNALIFSFEAKGVTVTPTE
jgi:hypothetical protein